MTTFGQHLRFIISTDGQRPFCAPQDLRSDPDIPQEDDTTLVLEVAQALCGRVEPTLERLDPDRSDPSMRPGVLSNRISRLVALYRYIGTNPAIDYSDSLADASGIWTSVLACDKRAPGAETSRIQEVCSARTALANASRPIPPNNLKLLHLVSNLLYRYCQWIEYDEKEALRASRAADEAAARWGY